MMPDLPSDEFPLVTIVTASLNQGHYIRDTIESVLSQDYPNIEYLVMDGGSTDETLSILAEYNGRIRWISENDRGQSHAINKGFALTRGRILNWLNSDDILLPGAVSAAVAAFRENPALGLVYGDGRELNGASQPVKDVRMPEPDIWSLVHSADYVIEPAAFFSREAFESVGCLDETLIWAMDYDLFIRISLRYPTIHLPRILAEFRVYDDCKTASGGWRRYREIMGIVSRYSLQQVPPAYLHYGWEFVHQTIRRWSLRKNGAGLAGRANRLLETFRDRIEARLATAGSAWYPDGWGAPLINLFLLNERAAAIELIGRVPNQPYIKEPQRIRIYMDGALVRDQILPPGEFGMILPIEPSHSRDVLHLQIRASQSFVPAAIEGTADFRRLAVCFDSIGWAGANGVPRPIAGHHPDGWAGPTVATIVEAAGGTIEITGCVPEWITTLSGQFLQIRMNGRLQEGIPVGPGEFRCAFAAPPGEAPVEIEISAARWFVPQDENLGDDTRRLAFLLHAIRSIPRQPAAIPSLVPL